MEILRLFMKQTAKLLMAIFPAILAGDLIYLYFANRWREPNGFILLAEFIILSLVIIIYTRKFIFECISMWRKENES